MTEAKRGDIWLIDLADPVDHEQGFPRTGVVVSHNALNRSRADLVIVVPVTRTQRGLPSHVEIAADGASGLTDTSYAQTEQVRAVSATRLGRRLGAVASGEQAQIDRSLQRMLDL